MNWNMWIRRIHRWLSIIFTLVVLAIFGMLGAGHEPEPFIYFLPLFPLALLMLTGLYLFVLPYVSADAAFRKGGRSRGSRAERRRSMPNPVIPALRPRLRRRSG
ncbi:MAG: hypothetical protein ACXW2T_10415, partial [Allosphingosinicella sp.]